MPHEAIGEKVYVVGENLRVFEYEEDAKKFVQDKSWSMQYEIAEVLTIEERCGGGPSEFLALRTFIDGKEVYDSRFGVSK